MSNNEDNENTSDTGTSSPTQTNTGTGAGAGTATGTSSRVIIAPTEPAGMLVFTKPIPTITSFYKIAPDHHVTFGWNFTYLKAIPESLTVSAYCQDRNTYAVGPNESGAIPGTATEVVWDVWSYQQSHPETPLPQARCNLMIADERGFNVRARPGYLSPNVDLQFAFYTPQPYKSFDEGWTCAACSSASSLTSHPAAISLLVTVMICLFSGFHLLRPTPAPGRRP